MRIYTSFDDPRMPLRDVPAYAQRAERLGFAGLLVPESIHDGFLAAALALEHTERIEVATSVLLAFPRSPTVVAYAAWDLQSFSGGRFRLGLGSQIKGNIVGRFGVEWKPPVARMRDYVGALRAVWSCWQHGTELDYRSEHYRIDRMQPFFNAGPIEHPDIAILLGGVNRRMTRLAGAVADGLMTHPTNTSPRYLRERVLPELTAGAAGAGRAATEVEILASTFVATGPDRAAVAAERERIRDFLGFLYSTPQYAPTLELYGWADLGRRLHELSRQGLWAEMRALVSDDILDALVPCGSYDEIAPVLTSWYGDVAAGITLRMPDDTAFDPALARLIAELAAG